MRFFVTKKKMRQISREQHDQALAEFVQMLRKKDKIYLEPVTLVGDNQNIQNCMFISNFKNQSGLYIVSNKKKEEGDEGGEEE